MNPDIDYALDDGLVPADEPEGDRVVAGPVVMSLGFSSATAAAAAARNANPSAERIAAL